MRKSGSGCLGVRLPIHPVLLRLAVRPRPPGRMRAEGKARAGVEEETTIRKITRKKEILRQRRQNRGNSMTQETPLDRAQTMCRERTTNLPANGSGVNSNPHVSRIVILEDQMSMAEVALSPGVQKQLKMHRKGSSWSNGLFYFRQLSWECVSTYSLAHTAENPAPLENHRQSYPGSSSRQSSSRVDCIRNLRSIWTIFYKKGLARRH